MLLRTCTVGPWAVNAYALICPDTLASVLIDPGAEHERLQTLVEGTHPQAILITHGHMDHVGALAQMRRRIAVPVMAHPGRGDQPAVDADQWLHGGERLPVGNCHVQVFYTPGHTDDQVSYGTADGTGALYVVGDTLFEGGPGKTWSSQGFQTTVDSLRRVVLTWPGEAVCYPGHGSAFRLGDKRSAIQRFVDKDHGGFFGDAHW